MRAVKSKRSRRARAGGTTVGSLSRALEKCTSPLDLLRLARTPAPSPVMAAVLHGAFIGPDQLSVEDRAHWDRVVTHEPESYPPREIVFCVGRRGLKTSTAALLLVFHVLCVAHDDEALAGSALTFPVVSPSKKQSRTALTSIRLVLDSLAALGVRFEERVSEDATEITILAPPSSVTKKITIFAAQDRTARGFASPCFVIDEAGHHAPEVDRELAPALSGGTLQFSRAMAIRAGTPGAVGSSFEAAVTKPSPNTLVVRGASFDLNPRITREQAWQLAETEAQGDPQRFYDQEVLAKRFGARDESYVSSDAVALCVDPDRDRTPRRAHVCIGLDVALTGRDSTAAVAALHEQNEDVTGSHPISHAVVLEVIELRGKPGAPLELPNVLDEIARMARRWPTPSGAPAELRFDQHLGTEVARGLRERGIVVAQQVPMHPTAQEARWRTLAALIRSRRLHLPPNVPELLRQLSQLKTTQLASGAHKVEGRRDDLADALAIAVERALELPPSGARGRHKVEVADVIHGPGGGRSTRLRERWVDDEGELTTPPIEDPAYVEMLAMCRATGAYSRAACEFFERAAREGLDQDEALLRLRSERNQPSRVLEAHGRLLVGGLASLLRRR